MSYKTDLEGYIHESYQIIHEYEDISRLSNDPKEKGRAKKAIEEQWMIIKGHLDTYIHLCERLRISIPDDLVEIMLRFPSFGNTIRTSTQTIEIFFSYAHEDERLRDQLEKQLSLLKWQGLVNDWHDRQINPGKVWADEIDSHLNTAHIILLLISADFMDSNYCYGIEMKRALERQKAGEVIVIPIILRPADWKSAPFSHLQVLPKGGKPITTWSNMDQAFLSVAEGIRKVVEELKAK